ncbi:MAG: hypothetical protein ABSG38_18520 [Spirochaetia bacterium]|jgi:hypothetical protein
MGWSTVYLILAIIAAILGIWNLARQRNVFLSLTGILWFLIVLFMQYIPKVYNYSLISGLPELGPLLLLVLMPIFVILAFFAAGRR